MILSCKGNKANELSSEEIEFQKEALTDSLLNLIDGFLDEYVSASDNSFRLSDFQLTETEKMVKPDFLLDPSAANTLLTRSQKVNALAIYAIEFGIRQIYGMPLDETKAVIAKLSADVSPIDLSQFTEPMSRSEKIRKEYDACKERDELSFFWQFQNAAIVETAYFLDKKPELASGRITEEQWQQFSERIEIVVNVINELSQFDEQINTAMTFRKGDDSATSRNSLLQ